MLQLQRIKDLFLFPTYYCWVVVFTGLGWNVVLKIATCLIGWHLEQESFNDISSDTMWQVVLQLHARHSISSAICFNAPARNKAKGSEGAVFVSQQEALSMLPAGAEETCIILEVNGRAVAYPDTQVRQIGVGSEQSRVVRVSETRVGRVGRPRDAKGRRVGGRRGVPRR